jgi:replicative superfamily II helicase
VLKQTIKYGIAYHHSGLTNDEKSIIERGFRNSTLLVLVATSTLSTGINLPAKAVIFKTPKIAINLMDSAKYKQMSGRAGRTGFDTSGDSIMICTDKQQLKHCRNVLLQPF